MEKVKEMIHEKGKKRERQQRDKDRKKGRV